MAYVAAIQDLGVGKSRESLAISIKFHTYRTTANATILAMTKAPTVEGVRQNGA